MKIYFGEINLATYPLDTIEDPYEFKGKYYWYEMTVDEDGITVRDTCGRYIPIDRNDCKAFGTALFVANGIFDAVDAGQALTDSRVREVVEVANHFGAVSIV